MLEGYLTANEIYPHYINNYGFTFKDKPPQKEVVAFLAEQEAWTKTSISQGVNSTFWQHIGAIQAQFEGLIAGYGLAAKAGKVPTIDRFGFQMLNAIGDLFQITPAVVPGLRKDWGRMNRETLRTELRKAGHCSGLIKVTGGFEDLFMAHSSWFEYANTNRIFKHYHFDFVAPAGANKISYSSYPGYLESLDDFYMMDSGLGMVQTSNDIMNDMLFDLITPKSLLAWQRVRAASAIASTGQEWHQTFQTHASGTYVNQYMVVDFKRFTPGSALLPGTLWVVEEIPGLVLGADQTATLARGYWPSYNVPFYAEIYKRSGYSLYLDSTPLRGPAYDGGGEEYTIGAARAKIFRRDQDKVVDMASFKRIMRYANYSDPYSRNANGKVDYAAAICMRGDLEQGGAGESSGCYDSKVTSYLHGFQNLTCEAVNGPSSNVSSGTSTLAPFAWRAVVDAETLHVGLPQDLDFEFIRMAPSAL